MDSTSEGSVELSLGTFSLLHKIVGDSGENESVDEVISRLCREHLAIKYIQKNDMIALRAVLTK